MKKTPSTFRAARELAGLSQFELAARVGVTPPAVSLWESGQRTPSGPARLLLSAVLSVAAETVDSWFGDAEPARAAGGAR